MRKLEEDEQRRNRHVSFEEDVEVNLEQTEEEAYLSQGSQEDGSSMELSEEIRRQVDSSRYSKSPSKHHQPRRVKKLARKTTEDAKDREIAELKRMMLAMTQNFQRLEALTSSRGNKDNFASAEEPSEEVSQFVPQERRQTKVKSRQAVKKVSQQRQMPTQKRVSSRAQEQQ